jgi:UMP-CMP kinase
MPPRFDNSKVMVIYVLGGPGAGKVQWSLFKFNVWLNIVTGKGTQCGRLVQDFGFCHLSSELFNSPFSP